MAAFTDQEAADAVLDWRILRDGSVALYHSFDLLEQDTRWLSLRGYEIRKLDCASWRSLAAMHSDLADVLAFPAYYGGNLDALRDCMLNDLEIDAGSGLTIILTRFDRFARGLGAPTSTETRNVAHIVLDIFAEASRQWMLTGKRLFTLVQTNDPWIELPALGAIGARWNNKEWLRKDRGC